MCLWNILAGIVLRWACGECDDETRILPLGYLSAAAGFIPQPAVGPLRPRTWSFLFCLWVLSRTWTSADVHAELEKKTHTAISEGYRKGLRQRGCPVCLGEPGRPHGESGLAGRGLGAATTGPRAPSEPLCGLRLPTERSSRRSLLGMSRSPTVHRGGVLPTPPQKSSFLPLDAAKCDLALEASLENPRPLDGVATVGRGVDVFSSLDSHGRSELGLFLLRVPAQGPVPAESLQR